MINLKEYRRYMERIPGRIPALTGMLPVTIDDDMAKKILDLPKDSITLFMLPPAAESIGKNADNYTESNECVIFVMVKYDPQRSDAISALELTQPVVDSIKNMMIADMSMGCGLIRLDVGSFTTLPETRFFAGYAGWSLGFKIKS